MQTIPLGYKKEFQRKFLCQLRNYEFPAAPVIQDNGWQRCHKHIHNPPENCDLAEFSVYSTATGSSSNGDGDLGSGHSLRSSPYVKPLPCIASQKSLFSTEGTMRADTKGCSITVRSPARKISMKQEIEVGDLVVIRPSAPRDYCNCVAVVTNVFKKHCNCDYIGPDTMLCCG